MAESRHPESRHRSIILLLCCMAQLIVILDAAIVNVALPSIGRDLEFSTTGLHWVFNAYTLTFAGFLMLGGRAGDLIGRREVFAAGLILFAISSLIGGVAQSKEMLVAARAVQGIGAAAIAPTSLAILMTTFTEGTERNRALGMWGAMGAIGGAAGALLGGLLTDALSWRWVLLINVPICAGMAVGAVAYVRHVVDRGGHRRSDVAGALLVTTGLVILTYGIVGTESHGWGSARTLLTLGAGLTLIALFLLVEGRIASDPLVPLRIFRLRSVSVSWIAALCLGATSFSTWYLIALISQNGLGYTALESGLIFLPMTMVVMVVSRLGGVASTWFGAGRVLGAGMATVGLGIIWLSRIPADGTFLANILGPSLVIGVGFGAAYVALAVSATSGIPGKDAGLASALTNMGRQVGGSLGIALVSAVAAAYTASMSGVGESPAALNSGYTRALMVAMGFSFTGAVLSFVGLGLRRGESAPTGLAREPVG